MFLDRQDTKNTKEKRGRGDLRQWIRRVLVTRPDVDSLPSRLLESGYGTATTKPSAMVERRVKIVELVD